MEREIVEVEAGIEIEGAGIKERKMVEKIKKIEKTKKTEKKKKIIKAVEDMIKKKI